MVEILDRSGGVGISVEGRYAPTTYRRVSTLHKALDISTHGQSGPLPLLHF